MIWCIKTYTIAYVKTQKIRFIIYYVIGQLGIGDGRSNFQNKSHFRSSTVDITSANLLHHKTHLGSTISVMKHALIYVLHGQITVIFGNSVKTLDIKTTSSPYL